MRQGHAVAVPPRAVDVLIALVKQRGTAVSKDDLMRAVWQEDIVEENNLTVSISALRKALGESIRDHRYIVTIPRRGYTFVAGVAERSDTAVDAHGATAGTHGRSHLLVLPSTSSMEAPSPAAASLAQAVADGCAARLGSNQHLAVLTRSPARARSRNRPARHRAQAQCLLHTDGDLPD